MNFNGDDIKVQETNEAMLRKVIIRLLAEKPFFAHILQSMNHIYTEDVPTAGVFITLTTNLYINPKWFSNLTRKEQVAVLEHEVYHLIHQHIPRYLSGKFDMKLYNIAADVAINQHITNLPEGCLLPETFALPNNETTEFYYNKLKEYPSTKIKQVSTLDNHDLWEKSKEYGSLAEERLKELLKEAVEKSGFKAGDAPQNLRRDFNWIFESTFNWKNLLNSYLNKASMKKFYRTKTKPSRRYGIKYPGIKSNYDLIVGVGVDLSGSINKDAQEKFYSWLDMIKKTTPYKLIISEFDTEVKRTYEFTCREDVKIPLGGGGTHFIPVLKELNEKDVDIILMFTDGENDNETIDPPKKDLIWILFEQAQSIKYDFGKIVYITD